MMGRQLLTRRQDEVLRYIAAYRAAKGRAMQRSSQ